MKETIGLISGLIVTLSVIPYGVRVYQRKVKPNLISWGVWAILGLAILLTFRSSGATSNVWPALFGFTNPLVIFILAYKRGERKMPDTLEIICAVIGILAIILWCFVRGSVEFSQYALYVAIVADGFAAIPTIIFIWGNPDGDRPLMWLLFSIGYGISIFAIENHNFANYVLPVYMSGASALITLPMIVYRIRKKIPLSEWM